MSEVHVVVLSLLKIRSEMWELPLESKRVINKKGLEWVNRLHQAEVKVRNIPSCF